MALFGPVTTPTFDPSLVAMQPGALRDMNSTTPQIQPRQGLFGNRNRWADVAAGIADATAPYTLHPYASNLTHDLHAQRKKDEQAKAQQDAFAAAYDPATGKLDAGKFIAAITQSGGDLPDSVLTSLIPKAKDPQVITRPDGSFGTLDPSDPQSWHQIGEPVAKPVDESLEEMRRAQTDYYRAGVPLRQAQTAYQGVKAAHPYAPQRPRAAGSVIRANPNTVSWD